MAERLDEIKERLASYRRWEREGFPEGWTQDDPNPTYDFSRHAPYDIEWLIAEVEQCRTTPGEVAR